MLAGLFYSLLITDLATESLLSLAYSLAYKANNDRALS